MIFSESLSKFVRTHEYVAQLVEFGAPTLEAFASFARLLRKRLKGLAPEQVALAGLVLTHYRVGNDGALVGEGPEGEMSTLNPTTDNGVRDAQNQEKKYLADLIEKFNMAFGKGISD